MPSKFQEHFRKKQPKGYSVYNGRVNFNTYLDRETFDGLVEMSGYMKQSVSSLIRTACKQFLKDDE